MQVQAHELECGNVCMLPDTYSKIIKAIRARWEGDHEMLNVCCCQTLMIRLLIASWSEQKRPNVKRNCTRHAEEHALEKIETMF